MLGKSFIVIACLFNSWIINYAQPGRPNERPVKILVLAENGGHHIKYTAAAKVWLDELASNNSFTIDYIQDTKLIDEPFLEQYQIFIQLDFPPYAWTKTAVQAFEKFMQRGRGGWIGFHHATLLGEFDGHPMWNWFSDFMGGIHWKNYIATFATGRVNVEQTKHPVMKGIPQQFIIENEEWYTWDKSPRHNVRVLASVDESTYYPDSEVKMGDHPVVWTNEKLPTRNVYIFMGHSPDLFRNESYTKLFKNSIFWMLSRK